MSFREPPRWAAWRHLDAREGFDVVFVQPDARSVSTVTDLLAAESLRKAGLSSAGRAVAELAGEVRSGGRELIDRWADAHIRVLVTAEQL